MARINVDDQFWIDVAAVTSRLGGDYDKAVGLCLRWCQYAQVQAKKSRQIPVDEFRARFSEALCPEFAEITGDFAEARGEARQFDWLLEKAEGGRVGGSKTSQAKRDAARAREAKKRAQRSTNTTTRHTEHKPTTADHNGSTNHKLPQAELVVAEASNSAELREAKAQAPQASPSFSPSPSGSRSNSELNTNPSEQQRLNAAPPPEAVSPTNNPRPGGTLQLPGLSLPPPAKKTKAPVVDGKLKQELIAHYCEAWKKAYRTPRSPDITGRAVGQLTTLIRDVGPERAKKLISAYLKMPDKFYINKRHDIATLVMNVTAVGHFADSGKFITQTELQKIDKDATNRNTLDAIERGEI